MTTDAVSEMRSPRRVHSYLRGQRDGATAGAPACLLRDTGERPLLRERVTSLQTRAAEDCPAPNSHDHRSPPDLRECAPSYATASNHPHVLPPADRSGAREGARSEDGLGGSGRKERTRRAPWGASLWRLTLRPFERATAGDLSDPTGRRSLPRTDEGSPSWRSELLAKAVVLSLCLSGCAAPARGPLAVLQVTVVPSDAALTVDGDRLQLKPGTKLMVEPNVPHRLVATKDGDSNETTITLEPGQRTEVELVVKKGGAAERSYVLPAVAFGVGGAGLVLGVVTGAMATVQMDDLKTKCGNELKCPDSLRGAYDSGLTLSRVATAGVVVAGIGAAVGVTLLLLPSKPKAGASLGVAIGPSYIGVKGAF